MRPSKSSHEMLIFGIYRPRNFAGSYLVRRFTIVPGVLDPAPDEDPFAIASTLAGARAVIPDDFIRVARHAEDDPALVETCV